MASRRACSASQKKPRTKTSSGASCGRGGGGRRRHRLVWLIFRGTVRLVKCLETKRGGGIFSPHGQDSGGWCPKHGKLMGLFGQGSGISFCLYSALKGGKGGGS